MGGRIPAICLCLLGLVAWVGARPVAAYKVQTTYGGKDIKWESPRAVFQADPAGGPPGAAAALQAALGTWTAVPTSAFVFSYGGEQAGTCGLMDQVNRFCFSPSADDGTVAENTFWYNTLTGFLIDSDIRFNTTYAFSTDAAPDAYDLQNVATHELGHSLSLSDLYGAENVWKTMYGYVSVGETQKRTLHPDDMDGISYLYPAAAAPWAVTREAADITRRSATLQGTVNPRGAPTRYAFEVGAEGEELVLHEGPGTLRGREPLDVELRVVGLKPGTIYHFRIVAHSKGGRSQGEMHTFRTEPKAPNLTPVYRLLLENRPE